MSYINTQLSYNGTPDNILIAVIFAAVVILLLIFYAVIFMINDYFSTKKVEQKAPNTHRLLVDLQHEMLNEMKGTARQNTMMIELTILFILVSIFGTIITIQGPKESAETAKQVESLTRSLIHNAFHGPR